jgi:hypothetical protein
MVVRDDGRGMDQQLLWSRVGGGTEVTLVVPGRVAFPAAPGGLGKLRLGKLLSRWSRRD